MWLRLLLLILYFIFLFILSRILETVSWYQGTETFFTSFVTLDPISLSVKKLKQLLDSRGINYLTVVEKDELIHLVASSGEPTKEELVDDVSSDKSSPETTQFTCGSHFYEEVEDTKHSAWLVQVVMNDEDIPLLSKNVWNDVVFKVSKFGIRTGHFKCSLDKRLCQRKGWTTNRIILALPQVNKAKDDVALFDYLQPSTSSSVLRWVRNHLASQVTKINSTKELKSWLDYSDDQTAEIRVIFLSFLKSCPLFLSALAIRYNERVKFGVVDVSKDNYKKVVNDISFPSYLIITPEKTYAYGSRKGECFNFKSMNLFLQTFVPHMNVVFMWSLLIINALNSLELFLMHNQIWKHIIVFLLNTVKHNAVLFLFWMLYLTFNQFPFMVASTNGLLKILRIISGSYLASIIRSDFKSFYSFTFLCVSFAVFGILAGIFLKKMKLIQEDDNYLNSMWWFSSFNELTTTYVFRSVSTLNRPSVLDLDLEVGMDLFIERLAVPNLWLRPVISMDYIKDLLVWKYQGWCDADDAIENKCDVLHSSDDESANVTTYKSVIENIVPNNQTVDNLSLKSSISLCTNISSQSKSEKDNPCNNENTVNSSSVLSSNFSATKMADVSDIERAPKGMLEFRECSICLESYKYEEYLCGLPCGHNFHSNCIMMWLTRDNHCCPICRWPAYKTKIHLPHLHVQ